MSGATGNDVALYGGEMELYREDSQYQENIMNSLFGFIRKAKAGEVKFDGKNWNIFAKLQLNESYAAITDTERLPESGFLKGVFAQYRVKQHYSSLEMTTFAATRGHKGGRVDGKYLDDQVKGTLMTFLSNLDFDAYGNGRGYRATIATATAAATSFTVVTSAMLRPGMKFDWYDSTLATKRGSIAVALKGIDRMSKTVYIDTTFGTGAVPAGAVATDVLVVLGALAPGEPSDGRYMAGLQRITDNTLALGGLLPSDYAAWTAVVNSASGGNPSQELLQIQWDSQYIISQMYPNRFTFNPAWKRGYLNQFLNQRRFTSNVFETGATKLTFSPLKMGEDEKNKKPSDFKMLEDKNCPPDVNYLWADQALCIATDYADTPHLADEDGSEFRFRLGYDSMQGFYRYWPNTVIDQRNGLGAITGYAIPSSVI